MRQFEYNFVQIGSGMLGLRRDIRVEYQAAIAEHARDGWRLVQVFAPATGRDSRALFCDAIFERPVTA